MSQSSSGYRWTELLLGGLLLASLATNYFLSREVRQLRGAVFALKNEGRLAAGAQVPIIEGLDPEGNLITIDYAANSRPTLLYVFSPGCTWCARNQESFSTLVNAIQDQNSIFGISLTPKGVKEYVQTHGYSFPTIANLPPQTAETYRFGGTPQTLLISPRGRVLKNWMGAYTDRVKTDLESYFGVDLPEVPLSGFPDRVASSSN